MHTKCTYMAIDHFYILVCLLCANRAQASLEDVYTFNKPKYRSTYNVKAVKYIHFSKLKDANLT